MNEDRPFWRSGSVLLALLALVVVVVADAVFRHTGGKPADFTLFVGRFHPLVVHLPIGFVLLVAAAEAATLAPRLRARIDPVVTLALPLLVLATASAFLLGHLLARSGDFAPGVLNVHRRFELFATVGICLCPLAWEYQERSASARSRWLYRGLLGVALGVLSIGAHFGGSLTRGDSYLTRYAPGPFKALLGGAPAPAAAASTAAKDPPREPHLYADVIQPILDERCVQCHGPDKVKGSLRLDSLAALQKGGEDGAVVTPGNPGDSPLLARTLLPADDDDHMPPEGKPGLTPPEVAAVRFWIERGADDKLLVRDLLVPADARSVLERALTGSATTKIPSTIGSSSAVDSAAAVNSANSASKQPTAPDEAAPTSSGDPPAQAKPAARADPAPHSPQTHQSALSILADKCVKCHGPAKQKGKLRLDSLAAVEQGGKSGAAVTPGDTGASLLLRRVSLPGDDEKHMPPSKEPQLDASERAALAAWVRGLDRPTPRAVVPASAEGTHRASPSPAATSRTSAAREESSVPPTVNAAASSSASSSSASSSSASSSTAASSTSPSDSSRAPPELLAELPSALALYPSEVAPLLHSYCAACHGGKSPAGGLAVDDYGALLQGGDTGPAVTPGKPEASLLVHRISLPAADDDHMPPSDERQLSADDIALVTAWVARGAGADAAVALGDLPGPAVAAIAAHPPSSTPSAVAPENPPPRAETNVALASPPPRGAGCGACALGDAKNAPFGSVLATLALGFATAARRRRTARPAVRSG